MAACTGINERHGMHSLEVSTITSGYSNRVTRTPAKMKCILSTQHTSIRWPALFLLRETANYTVLEWIVTSSLGIPRPPIQDRDNETGSPKGLSSVDRSGHPGFNMALEGDRPIVSNLACKKCQRPMMSLW